MGYQERLERLPLRAVVAFAARCARRVEPLTARMDAQSRESVRRAIDLADAVSKTVAAVPGAAEAALKAVATAETAARSAPYSAASAAQAAARAALAAAYTAESGPNSAAGAAKAAAEAAEAAAAAVASADREAVPHVAAKASIGLAADADLYHLVDLDLGYPGQFGNPIDPSDSGPLGALWPKGVNIWLSDPAPHPQSAVLPTASIVLPAHTIHAAAYSKDVRPEPLVSVVFDSNLTAEDMELFLSYLSEIYRELGGPGLKVVGGETLQPEEAEVLCE